MRVSMKRFLVIIAMLCMAIFSVMLVTACGEGEKAEHQHNWDSGVILDGDEPTCTEAGKRTYHCLAENCPQQTKTEVIPKLGHAFANKYTVEKEPTLTEEGWESQHCNKCDATRNGRAIPKISESGIWYRIKVNRWNGYRLYNFPRIAIYNENGDKMHDAEYLQLTEVSSGVTETEYFQIEVSLPLGEYKVVLMNIPEGFDYEPFYVVSGENSTASYDKDKPETYPELDIRLSSHLREGSLPAKMSLGEVFPDFKINSWNKGEVMLSDLLEEYELVFLHFYYNNCQYCRQEAPVFMEVYEEYKDHIAVVCFNTQDSKDSTLNNYKSIFGYSDDFYYLSDGTGAWQNRVLDGAGVPSTVVIDRGGYFASRLATVVNKTQVMRVIKANLPELEAEEQTAPVSMAEVDMILPDKRSYAL